jgi:hypothetical protein
MADNTVAMWGYIQIYYIDNARGAQLAETNENTVTFWYPFNS